MQVIRLDDDLPEGIETLAAEARAEGWSHIDRLIAGWAAGERFDAPGEALFAIIVGGDLAGIGGVTREPGDPSGDVLRARRLYVSPRFRGQGAGRLLASAIIQQGFDTASRLVVNAGRGAGPFWEGFGFMPVASEGITHQLLRS
jgi:GNAT superfamily N-acetyltransferase